MSLLSAAIAYAKMGIKIFPLAPRSKKPLEGGHGLLDATSDVDEVTEFWTNHPDYNIGCNCGESRLAVLDADLYKPMAEEALEALAEKMGSIPDTWTALTGGGGTQYFFSTAHLDERLRSGADCFGDGLDFKANGGYVVLPPSVHPSGKKYEWELSSTPMNCDLAPVPTALTKMRTKQKPEPREASEVPPDAEHLRAALAVIPAENYTQWIEIGMAIKASLGEPGFALWDNWSRGSTKYDAEEMRSKWDSFKGSGVTASTLFHYAIEQGWQPPTYTIEDFRRDTKGWVGETAQKASEGFPVILAADIQPRQLEWLIEHAVAVNTCGFMAGHPGTFKSWACAEMAVAVASGDRAFGTLKTRQGAVVLFNAEDDPAIITRARLDRLAKGRNLELGKLPIYLVNVDSLRLDKPEDVARLRISVRELRASLLVLDPLRNLHWVNEDSSTEMTPILAGVRSIQRQTGCSVLLVHHDRKGGDERRESRVRGSNSLEGWRDFALYCDTVCEQTVSVQPYVKGCAVPTPWSFRVQDMPNGASTVITTSKEEQLADKGLRVLREHPDGMTRTEFRVAMGVRDTTAGLMLKHMVDKCSAVETLEPRTRSNGKSYPTTVYRAVDDSWCPSKSQSQCPSPIRGGRDIELMFGRDIEPPGGTLTGGTLNPPEAH